MSSKSATSWRDTISVHPAADLFPLMSVTDPQALEALGEDIKKNELRSPIVLWSDGKSPAVLLDGRNRLDAIESRIGRPVIIGPPSLMAGENFLATNMVIVLDRSVDPYSYCVSANIHRRHLTIEDKDRLIVQLLTADPTKSNRAVAKLTDTSHPHVAKVREQAERTGDVESVTTSIDAKGRKHPTKKKRRTEDDFRRDLQAKKAAAMPGDIGPMLPDAPAPAPAPAKTPARKAIDRCLRTVRAAVRKAMRETEPAEWMRLIDTLVKELSDLAVDAAVEAERRRPAPSPPVAPAPDDDLDQPVEIAS